VGACEQEEEAKDRRIRIEISPNQNRLSMAAPKLPPGSYDTIEFDCNSMT